MNAGLQMGSLEWARAIQVHYSLDPDIHALCECFIAEKKRVDIFVKEARTNRDKIHSLNVLAAHVTELSEQMVRAVGTMKDMVKEKVDGEG